MASTSFPCIRWQYEKYEVFLPFVCAKVLRQAKPPSAARGAESLLENQGGCLNGSWLLQISVLERLHIVVLNLRYCKRQKTGIAAGEKIPGFGRFKNG